MTPCLNTGPIPRYLYIYPNEEQHGNIEFYLLWLQNRGEHDPLGIPFVREIRITGFHRNNFQHVM